MKAVCKKKLAERLEQPHVPSPKLHGQKDRCKIKLRDAGYRLVCEDQNEIVTVLVVAVGKREREARLQGRCEAMSPGAAPV